MENFNLIDLSIDDDTITKNQNVTSTMKNGMELSLADLLSPNRRLSFENNPFDLVQKLANQPTDPFDLVENQAKCGQQNFTEVKVANLLSLTDEDNLDADSHYTSMNESTPPTNKSHKSSNYISTEDLIKISPPQYMRDSLERSDGSTSSIENKTYTSKTKNVLEKRKQLLKLSLTNSTFNTPENIKLIQSEESGFSSEERCKTPLSSLFQNTTDCCMLSAESPLKLVDDEISLETIKSNNETTNEIRDYEEDLKMMNIPMLQCLPSSLTEFPIEVKEKSPVTPKRNDALSDLENLRAKIRSRRSTNMYNDKSDVKTVIENLKMLIYESDIGDVHKKEHAHNLLEMLSSTLTDKTVNNNNMLEVPQEPIKRQGTFDLDLQNATRVNFVSQKNNDVMTSSTGTFDGNNSDDKSDLHLPEVDPPINNKQLDFNNIIEQLSRMLSQHNLGQDQQAQETAECHTNVGSDNIHNVNPTFIVLMNAPQELSEVNTLEQSVNDSPIEVEKRNYKNEAASKMRRRSQSLSLHDKIKIVHLPLPKTAHIPTISPKLSTKKQTTDKHNSNEIDFKTPTRLMRRNSYSSGTPYTPINNVTTFSKRENENVQKIRRSTAGLETCHEVQNPMLSNKNRPTNMPSKLDFRRKHKTESIMKSSAPLKATIPVKKIAPTFKTSPPTPQQTAYKEDISMLCTSTPMPAIVPSAFSTPAAYTPNKRDNGLTKSRLSYTSAATPLSSTLRRRTINELKTKSPIKPRIASSGGITKTNISRCTQLKLPTRNIPTTNKTLVNRLRNSTDTKENWHP